MTLLRSALKKADQTLHSLSQLLAMTAMQGLPSRPDDSQTNLGWNSNLHRLEGRPFIQNGHLLRMIIDTATFTLQFVDEREHIWATFSPEKRTSADATSWWESQMQAWGMDDNKGLNYQLAYAPIAAQSVYERPDELPTWARWRTTANTALLALNKYSGHESEVRIWPHHFDTGVYYAQTDADGREKAAIWAGYAIADSLHNEPYFYLSGYRLGQSINFVAAPALSAGEWLNTPNWKGALLPISDADNEAALNQFFQEGFRWIAQATSDTFA
jgi:hypothetical protein